MVERMVPCMNRNRCGVQSHRAGSHAAMSCHKGQPSGYGVTLPAPQASSSASQSTSQTETARTAGGIERAFTAVDEQSDFGWGDMSGRDLARSLLSAGVRTDDGRDLKELIADLDDLRESVDGEIEADEYAVHLAERGWITRSPEADRSSDEQVQPGETPSIKGLLDDYASQTDQDWNPSSDHLVEHLVKARLDHPERREHARTFWLRRDLRFIHSEGTGDSAEETAEALTALGWSVSTETKDHERTAAHIEGVLEAKGVTFDGEWDGYQYSAVAQALLRSDLGSQKEWQHVWSNALEGNLRWIKRDGLGGSAKEIADELVKRGWSW